MKLGKSTCGFQCPCQSFLSISARHSPLLPEGAHNSTLRSQLLFWSIASSYSWFQPPTWLRGPEQINMTRDGKLYNWFGSITWNRTSSKGYETHKSHYTTVTTVYFICILVCIFHSKWNIQTHPKTICSMMPSVGLPTVQEPRHQSALPWSGGVRWEKKGGNMLPSEKNMA